MSSTSAAPAPVIKISGLRSTVSSLKKVAEETPMAVKSLNTTAARIVAADAVHRAPVGETGRLAGSIRMKSNLAAAFVLAGSESAVPYAGVIHFGWPDHNIDPEPFLYEALDARRAEVIAAYRTGIEEIIKTSGAGGGSVTE